MSKKENKIDFDLSVLSLSELIKLYEHIKNFVEFLDDRKIVEEEENLIDEDE